MNLDIYSPKRKEKKGKEKEKHGDMLMLFFCNLFSELQENKKSRKIYVWSFIGSI